MTKTPKSAKREIIFSIFAFPADIGFYIFIMLNMLIHYIIRIYKIFIYSDFYSIIISYFIPEFLKTILSNTTLYTKYFYQFFRLLLLVNIITKQKRPIPGSQHTQKWARILTPCSKQAGKHSIT
ncbi:hypothetical protein HK12_08720 [Acetobacter orientalis]|uniref:Uncharacterized protein n=1 Tax=Acetobacter orientalis TaxID=146474 RepID=A0A252A088_9PROT|nr:hypothetical protein HK12_08720 [Acetobacter orientalis]